MEKLHLLKYVILNKSWICNKKNKVQYAIGSLFSIIPKILSNCDFFAQSQLITTNISSRHTHTTIVLTTVLILLFPKLARIRHLYSEGSGG